MSTSVALRLTESLLCATTVKLVDGKTGGALASRTVTTKLAVVLNGDGALSVTFTTTVLVLGPCSSVGLQAMTPASLIVSPCGPLTSV